MLWVLVFSHPAAVHSSSGNSIPPPPPLAAGLAPSGLELSWCRGQGPCPTPLSRGPPRSPAGVSSRSLSGLHLAPTRSLSRPGSSPASLDSLLPGRQGLGLTPSKPVSSMANNPQQQDPHLTVCLRLSQPESLNSHIRPPRKRSKRLSFFTGEEKRSSERRVVSSETKRWQSRDLNPELLAVLLRASPWPPQLGVCLQGVYKSADEKVNR